MLALDTPIDRLGIDSEELRNGIAVLIPHESSDDNAPTNEAILSASALIDHCVAALGRDAKPTRQHTAVAMLLQLIRIATPKQEDPLGQQSPDPQHNWVIQQISSRSVVDSVVAIVLQQDDKTQPSALTLLTQMMTYEPTVKLYVSEHLGPLLDCLLRLSEENAATVSSLQRVIVYVADATGDSIAQVTDRCLTVLTTRQPQNDCRHLTAVVELLATLHKTGSTAASELVLNVLSQLIAQATAPGTSDAKPSADALVRVAKTSSLVEPLVEAGVILTCVKPLKCLLENRASKSSVSGHQALEILSSVSQSWDFGGLLLDEGAIALLVSLVLTTTESRVQVQCTEILSNISWTDEPTKHMVAITGCLDVFIEMVRSQDSSVRDAGVGAIAALCKDNEENVARVPVENVLASCVEMLQSPSPGDQQTLPTTTTPTTMALRLITSLVEDDVVGEEVASHGQIVDLTLEQLMNGAVPANQLQALLAIGGLVAHRASRERLEMMGVEATLSQLAETSTRLATYASMALVALKEPLPPLNGD